MKRKNLFLMFGFGAALLLGSCSQNEAVENEGGTPAQQSVVCFTSSGGDETTRTSMDPDGTFYWTAGDYIFVKDGTDYVKSNNAATSRVARENFYLNGVFTALSYPVVYTGNGDSALPNQVVVKDEQGQTVKDDATHLGTSGDCGNAVADQTGERSYKFDLVHRASYFVIAPRHAFPGQTVTLQKVEVTTTGSDNLCGTYTFSENTLSLKDEQVTSGKKAITLTTGDFTVPTVEEADADNSRLADARGYMVFQPGTHTLTFKYYVTVGGTAREFTKTVASREFLSGHFTNVKHILADGQFNGGHTNANSDPFGEINDDPRNFDYSDGEYYKWGATATYTNNGTYDQTTAAPTQLTMTSPVAWGELPNANELYSYIVYGNPRWDGSTVWSNDGGLTDRTGGIWLKKRSAIGSQFSSTVGKDGADMRSVYKTHSVSTTTYRTGGKPANTDDYFFLPALGYNLGGSLYYVGSNGYYWSRSPCPGGTSYAYGLYFYSGYVAVNYGTRYFGYVVAPGWFR